MILDSFSVRVEDCVLEAGARLKSTVFDRDVLAVEVDSTTHQEDTRRQANVAFRAVQKLNARLHRAYHFAIKKRL